MTPAVLLAAGAGVAVAAFLVDALALVAARRARTMPVGDAGRAGGEGGWGVALARLGRRLGAPAPPPSLAARMAAAGLPRRISVGDLMAAKAGGAVLGLALASPPASVAPARGALVVLALAAAAGFHGPDLALRRRAQRRAAAARAELADVVDLLRVAVEAGLPVGRAIDEVGRRRGGVLAGELRAVAARTALGVPRDAALLELAQRLPLPPVAALVAAITRAERHGAPPGAALHALAAEARAERARALREHAAAAAPRIQLAVALLLVPAAMLLLAAALLQGVGV